LYALNLWQDAELRRLLSEITEWEKMTTAWLASPDIKTAITKTAIAKTKGII
jgi:hypothetical protein